MKPIALTLASLLLCAAASHAVAQDKPAQRAFRWVDEKGVVHYGDSVPAEFSRQQTSQLNKQGVEVHQSPAQLSAGDARSAEEKAAAVARLKQHDSFLLATYASARDIEQLRDERMALVDAQIVAANGFLASAESRMKALLQRSKSFKPYSDNPTARRMPDTLAEEIVRTVNEERFQRGTVEKKKAEKDQLRATFQADIDRYQALLASRSGVGR